jgi:HemY protein
MIRVLFYVLLVFALAVGFVWLAERPGDITVVWQGYEIRTSLIIAAAALVLALVVIAILGALIRAVIRTPRSVGEFFGGRRRDRGYRALTRGMIAIGAGDPRAAKRASEEARALLGAEPLVLLLTAQAAQIAGDASAAREAFETLSVSRDTRLLGLHGLFVEARRQNEHAAARHFAEEAMLISGRIGWAGSALFEYQCQAREWQAALATLATNVESGAVEPERGKRLRAVLLTARAMELESGKPDEARGLAYEAHRLAPDLVPATVLSARLLTRNGEVRRAMRVLEHGWRAFPHPEIAEAYASVRPGDSVRDRLKRVRKLVEFRANNAEGGLAIARAAIDARDWATARAALAPFVQGDATERACLLMAEIEEGENGDQGRARMWLRRAVVAKRDPVWTADGRVFDAWAPISPVSGRLDAFEWRVVEQPPAPRALTAMDGAMQAALPADDDTAAQSAGSAVPSGAVRPPVGLPPAIAAVGAMDSGRTRPDDAEAPAAPAPLRPGRPVF